MLQHERKYVSKEAELQRPDILHPSLSFDQKLVTASDTGHLVTSPSHTTDLGTQLAQYCQHSDHSGDSGNRASVNSQVSNASTQLSANLGVEFFTLVSLFVQCKV